MSNNKNQAEDTPADANHETLNSQPGQTWRNVRQIREFVEKKIKEKIEDAAPSLDSEEKVINAMHICYIVSFWKDHVLNSMKNNVFHPADFVFHSISFWINHKGCRSVPKDLVLAKLFQASHELSGPWQDTESLRRVFSRHERHGKLREHAANKGMKDCDFNAFIEWFSE